MKSNRIAFVSALGLAILALFVFSGAEAATLNNPATIPDSARVDGEQEMQFTIEFDDQDEDVGDVTVYIIFDGSDTEFQLTCSDCVGEDPDGTYEIIGDLPAASTLVNSVGSENIFYGFYAELSNAEDDVWYAAPDSTHDTGVRVNTLPVLTDDGAVVGEGMPEDTYTLTITYTDLDNHAGTIGAIVCDASDVCEDEFFLSTGDSDYTDGAVYTADFTTFLGGDLTVTVNASDTHDFALNERTATFSVDTETPWLKTPTVSATDVGEADIITFTVVYCVFDADSDGDPTVEVEVGAWGNIVMNPGESSSDCVNGMTYTRDSSIPWANVAQDVTFHASNDNQAAESISGGSVIVNDAPAFDADSGIAERAENEVDFFFQVTASDVNSNDGDSFKAYVTIEGDEEEEMFCQVDGNCTITIAEADIINQMGGIRTVSFRLQDDIWGAEAIDDFGLTIDVTKTSDFGWVAPADGSFQPGLNDYEFEITNNGNAEDTFTITAVSDNGWVAVGSESQEVTVAKDATESFTITMDVAHVAAGLVDHWTVTATAGNNDSVSNSYNGKTTVASVSSVSVSIGTDTGSAIPGSDVIYSFLITNTGNAEDTFTYSATSGNDWGLAVDGSEVTLGMGESHVVEVTHTVSESASSGDTDQINFNAGEFPDGDGATATTSAGQVYGASIIFSSSNQPSTLNPGDSFTISYTVTNDGNGADDFSVFFDAPWMSSSSGTSLSLAEGASGTSTLTITVPADANSGSSSTASATVTDGGGATASFGPQAITVADNTRSASISTDSPYSHNSGEGASGTVTVTNTGVDASFLVSAMDDALSFDTSLIYLDAGQSGTLTFTVSAAATGDVSFTVSDSIDGISVAHTFDVTVNTFDSSLLTDVTSDCDTAGITCITDPAGGFANGEYTNAGTWYTTMTAIDSNGISGSHTFTTTIVNSAPSVVLPTVPEGTIAQELQSFSIPVPTDVDGTITQLVIDWGDGNKETFDAAFLAGKSAIAADHNYATAGTYQIKVTAYDNSGENNVQTTTIEVGDNTVTMGDNSYIYNLVALVGFFLLGVILSATSFKMKQGVIAGDEEMNERDRQRLESVERRMESLSEREELLEVSAYDASRAATKLEEHLAAFNEILVKAQEIAAEEKLKELEAAEESRAKEEEQMQLDLEDPDIEMVAERFHKALGRLVDARSELSKIEEQLAHILKMERDEQLEKLTEMTESYESTKRKIDALQSSAEAREAAAVENNIMNLLSAAASGGAVGGAADFGDFGDFDDDDDEYEVEIYEDEDGSFYYIDPDTGEEVPCDEDGNAL